MQLAPGLEQKVTTKITRLRDTLPERACYCAQTLRCGVWEKEGGGMRLTILWAGGGARAMTVGLDTAHHTDASCNFAPAQPIGKAKGDRGRCRA
jgi:hypothetical protein